jgi:hypothetical protein
MSWLAGLATRGLHLELEAQCAEDRQEWFQLDGGLPLLHETDEPFRDSCEVGEVALAQAEGAAAGTDLGAEGLGEFMGGHVHPSEPFVGMRVARVRYVRAGFTIFRLLERRIKSLLAGIGTFVPVFLGGRTWRMPRRLGFALGEGRRRHFQQEERGSHWNTNANRMMM